MTLAHFILLQFQQPGFEVLWPVAVLLFDPATGKIHVKGRADYSGIADPDDAIVLAETVKQLEVEAAREDGAATLDLLESSLSNSVRITERTAVRVTDFEAALDHLSKALLS